MLKGHVFSKQIFENPIFALWIDTLLDGKCGVGPYKNKMKVTSNGSTLTVQSGTVCIKGRFVEEDTSTPIAAGTDNAYCILVIEVDLDKTNTESELNQVAYKIIKGSSSYPSLTQTDIVKNNAGIYQYELARFRTGTTGITDFKDTRTFLDFESIYTSMQAEYRTILDELKGELENVESGSSYVLKNNIATLTGTVNKEGAVINYPAGFNKDNCVCISAMLQNQINPNGTWALGNAGIFNSSSYVVGSMPTAIILAEQIRIDLRNVNITEGDNQGVYASLEVGNFNYKITLMKI